MATVCSGQGSGSGYPFEPERSTKCGNVENHGHSPAWRRPSSGGAKGPTQAQLEERQARIRLYAYQALDDLCQQGSQLQDISQRVFYEMAQDTLYMLAYPIASWSCMSSTIRQQGLSHEMPSKVPNGSCSSVTLQPDSTRTRHHRPLAPHRRGSSSRYGAHQQERIHQQSLSCQSRCKP